MTSMLPTASATLLSSYMVETNVQSSMTFARKSMHFLWLLRTSMDFLGLLRTICLTQHTWSQDGIPDGV